MPFDQDFRILFQCRYIFTVKFIVLFSCNILKTIDYWINNCYHMIYFTLCDVSKNVCIHCTGLSPFAAFLVPEMSEKEDTQF